jgi:quinol monooxygenase YgiN
MEACMAKLAIIATIEVAPGRRAEFVPVLMAHKQRSLKEEPGTLQFEVLLPHDDETKVLLYELYRDAAAFEEHRNAASIARFREEASGMFGKILGTRCLLSE